MNFKDISEQCFENLDAVSIDATKSRRKNSSNMLMPTKKMSQMTNSSTNFNFPDGGWVCSQCQNYNFSGRVKCNRCNKGKSKLDYNGKPKHLLKKGPLNESICNENQPIFS